MILVLVSNSWDPWTVACQAPLSMGFPRWAYWSVLPLPSPGDLPNPGMEPGSPSTSQVITGESFTNCHTYHVPWASLVVQLVENPPAMRETWIWSLGWEDPLEWNITHSSILALRIPWTIVHGVAKTQTWLSNSHLYRVPSATLQPPADVPSLQSTRPCSLCRSFRTPRSGISLPAPSPVDSMTGKLHRHVSYSETTLPAARVLRFSSSPPSHHRAGPPFIMQDDWAVSVNVAKIERKEMEEACSCLKPQCRCDPCPFCLLPLARANHTPKSDICRTGKHHRSPEKGSYPRYYPPHLPMRQ